MASPKLLVVTGDYGIVQQVKQALGGRNFAIHTAYSHLDAIYQLKYEPFELVLVDALMTNRKTGEQTALALAQMEQHPPMLVYAVKNGHGVERPAAETDISSLDEATLVRAVTRLLHLTPLTADAGHEAKPSKDEPPNTSVFWRDDEMQTLFALGRSLTEVLDLSEVLNRVVEASRHLTNAEEGMILLPDGQSTQLYLRAKVGIDVEVADNFRIRTHDTIAGAVFESGQPILLGESGPQKVKTQYFVNSLLYVPISHKGTTLGVLGVNNKIKHDIFTARHRDLLINLASYAAIAIENARTHGQSIRRAHELKALVDASQMINASLSFEETLPAICEQLIHVLNVGHAEIYTWNGETEQLSLLARCQQSCWRSGQEPLIEWSKRPAIRQALENQQQLIENDYDALDETGARAMLVVPITGGDQMIGAAQAYYVTPPKQPITNDVIARAQRLILESWARASKSDHDAQFLAALEAAKAALEADWIEFMEVVPESAGLKLRYIVGGGVWIDEPRPRIDVADYPDLREALAMQRPLNHFQGEEKLPPGVRMLINRQYSRSLLALPLIGRGRTLGLVLFADMLHARAFTAREIDLGRAIVGQAAMALENMGLVHDLEASLHDLQEAQNRLIQGARLSAMGELAAAVAHQINNPLTTIVLDTELLLENEPPDTKDYEVLSAISRAGKRAASVVRRLLAMARPIAPDSQRSAVDVLDTIRDIATLVHPHVDREGIRLVVELPEEKIPALLSVSGELNDVWLNLILNAHDAVLGRKKPEIGIHAAYDPAHAVLDVTVWDNGPGIPAEIVGEIFKPFFTTKPQGEGTGLGLHICRQVVDRLGGAISVHTSASGTRFMVRLPITRSL